MAALRNHILATLSDADAAVLTPHLEPVDLPLRYPLEHPHRPIEYVYFPDEGLISVVTTGSLERQIEVGIIGRDGLSSVAVVLGVDRSPHSVFMQIAGRGRRVPVDVIRLAIERSPTLRQKLSLSAQAFVVQASYTALANGRAKIDARLARWLVMAHDRMEGDQLPLTHEFLAVMLGVRRPGVSVILQKFDALELVETKRSVIVIKNRKMLEEMADGFYGIPEDEQERLTGWRPPHRYFAT